MSGKRKVSFNCKDKKTGKVNERCFEAKEKKQSKGGSTKKTSSEPKQDPRNPEFPADKKMSNYANTGTKSE